MESKRKPHGKLITLACRVLDSAIDATVVLSYGNTGYKFRRATLWNNTDLAVELTGQVCAITGANSGIGLATAQQLARRGATVYLLVRNLERGVAVQARLRAAAGHSRVYLEAIDLSSIASVRACADRIQAQTQRLDILINNAGDAFDRRADTAQASFRYKVTSLTTLVLRADADRTRFTYTPGRNADGVRVMPGVEFDAFAIIQGSASGMIVASVLGGGTVTGSFRILSKR